MQSKVICNIMECKDLIDPRTSVNIFLILWVFAYSDSADTGLRVASIFPLLNWFTISRINSDLYEAGKMQSVHIIPRLISFVKGKH